MNVINLITKVVSVIIACAVVLMVTIPNGIKTELISAGPYINPGYYTIKGGENISTEPISLLGAVTYNIILEDVYLDLSSTQNPAFYMADNTNVNLTLVGKNTLISGGNQAGISVGGNSILTIDGTGSLFVKGGNSDDKGGAGIGGGFGYTDGTVKINGGNIVAEGGYHSAGIGGSDSTGGAIEINGGIIKATGGLGGAGIGGGFGNRGGNISINGGTIIATAGSGAYDIGAGAEFTKTKGSTVITGGSVNNTTNTMYFGSTETKLRYEIHIPDCLSTSVASVGVGDYSYGMNDVCTDSKGLLYLWLPETLDKQDITVVIAGKAYTGVLSVESKVILKEYIGNAAETEVASESATIIENITQTTESFELETTLEEIEMSISETATLNTETATTETALEEIGTSISETAT